MLSYLIGCVSWQLWLFLVRTLRFVLCSVLTCPYIVVWSTLRSVVSVLLDIVWLVLSCCVILSVSTGCVW